MMSQDKFEFYSCIQCYEDGMLCIHHDPDDVLNKLNHHVSLKSGSVGSSNMFIGTKLQ